MENNRSTSAVDRVYFGKTDYALLGIMLLSSMAIGIFFAVSGSRQRTKVDYLLGNRRMGALPVCLSLFATFQSAISILGTPAEVYTYGIMIIYNFLAIVLANVISMWTLVPLMYPLKITSVYEAFGFWGLRFQANYLVRTFTHGFGACQGSCFVDWLVTLLYLEKRYASRSVRLFGTIVGVISSVSYMTIALLSPALALQTAADIPLWLSIVLIGTVGTIYTAVGGIRSVIWTDVFQTFIIFGGILVVLIKGSHDVGGMTKVWDIGKDSGRTVYDDIDPDPRVRHTVWGLTFGGLFYWTMVNFSQSSVQRISATRSLKHAKMVLLMAIPLATVYGLVLTLTGLILLAYFHVTDCDPLGAGYITNRNQLMPYFVMDALSFLPGLPGLYISTVFSGALSTLSSGINSLAANTVEDFIAKPLSRRKESTVTAITKCIVCLYGAAIIVLAYLAQHLTGPVTQITYSAVGATGGPVVGMFVLGATFPQANKVGAICGCVIGLIMSVTLNIGSFIYGKKTPMLPQGSTESCSLGNVSKVFLNGNNSYSFGEQPQGLGVDLTYVSEFLETTQANLVKGSSTEAFSLFDLSYVWLPMVGILGTLLTGLIISLISNRITGRTATPDSSLYFPVARSLWGMKKTDYVREELVSDLDEGLKLKIRH